MNISTAGEAERPGPGGCCAGADVCPQAMAFSLAFSVLWKDPTIPANLGCAPGPRVFQQGKVFSMLEDLNLLLGRAGELISLFEP